MKKALSPRILVRVGILTTILLILIIYTIWGNSALMVSTVNISSDRIPSVFSNFRIAQVSDLHNTEFGEGNTKLIEILSELKPDIIVITGDLIDARHTDIKIALDFVKGAVQIAPVYYVTGNHEANCSQYGQLKTGLEMAGVTILEDEALQLECDGEMLTLIGISDPDFTIKGDIFNEVPGMVKAKLNSLIDDNNNYMILLSHRPELFETYVAPIPVATLSNRELGTMGQNYLRSLFAVGFQGMLILVCVAIYAVLIQGIATSGDPIGAIWGCIGYTVLLCFMLMKTGTISKSIFSAH